MQQQISQLVAEQEIDQVNHSKRLPKLREELASIEQALVTWPDVEAELQRRLESAHTAVKQLEHKELLDELQTLMSDEVGKREAFQEMALQFVDSAATLKRLLDRKEAIKRELLETGRGGIDIGDPQLPAFYVGWVRNGQQGAAEARQHYARLKG